MRQAPLAQRRLAGSGAGRRPRFRPRRPAVLSDETVDDPWMGDGRSELGPADIRAGLRLYLAAWALTAVLIAGLWWVAGVHLSDL